MKHLIFVYGKLRRGGGLALSMNSPNSKFIADAKIAGALYDLGVYPGLLLEDSSSTVVGEVYEVDDATLSELDGIEASSEYWRRQIEVSLGGTEKKCWIYVPDYTAEFYSNRTRIPSGDWIEYANRRSGAI